jgi:Flavocytochrome c sulphide dehydrogenase, flavin-binding
MVDQLVPGGGSLVLLETALTHLQNLRPFAARISNGNPADGWSGNARAVIVANANYPWCPDARIDDGKLAATGVAGLAELVKRESDQAVLSGEDLFATVPYTTYLEIDGSLTDLVGGIAKKLGPIQSVTYRYSTKKIQMLLPYTIAQPLLTNPIAAPPEPADVAPLASETFFNLEAMADGGTVIISACENSFRCPPGPYERASLIAYYLKTKKPKSKLIILDAKDAFSKQRLFQNAWRELYPNLEWVSLSAGGKVTSIEAGAMTLVTDFGRHKADVANVIPPQKAGHIAELAGIADRSGWCPIDPVTFESKLQSNIHVIGDACIAGGMPKSAFAANAQAKVCAAAVTKLLAGAKPEQAKLINTCYSLVAPDYGISIAGVYQPADGQLKDVEGAGGVSPLDAPSSTRALEAQFANAWFKTITEEVFG